MFFGFVDCVLLFLGLKIGLWNKNKKWVFFINKIICLYMVKCDFSVYLIYLFDL